MNITMTRGGDQFDGEVVEVRCFACGIHRMVEEFTAVCLDKPAPFHLAIAVGQSEQQSCVEILNIFKDCPGRQQVRNRTDDNKKRCGRAQPQGLSSAATRDDAPATLPAAIGKEHKSPRQAADRRLPQRSSQLSGIRRRGADELQGADGPTRTVSQNGGAHRLQRYSLLKIGLPCADSIKLVTQGCQIAVGQMSVDCLWLPDTKSQRKDKRMTTCGGDLDHHDEVSHMLISSYGSHGGTAWILIKRKEKDLLCYLLL